MQTYFELRKPKKYNRDIRRPTFPHTSLQIVTNRHNQVWDRLFFKEFTQLSKHEFDKQTRIISKLELYFSAKSPQTNVLTTKSLM